MRVVLVTLYLASIGLLLGIETAIARNDTIRNDKKGFHLIFPIEYPIIDLKDFNQNLNAGNLPSAIYPTGNIGFGLQFLINQSIHSFSFIRKTKKDRSDNYDTRVQYQAITLNYGYSFSKNFRYSIYPFSGLKIVVLKYLYQEKVNVSIPFSNYLQSNLNYVEISRSDVNLDLGLGVSHQGFLLKNFKFGYLIPVKSSGWRINDGQTSLNNSPSFNYQFYFNLTLGLGFIDSILK